MKRNSISKLKAALSSQQTHSCCCSFFEKKAVLDECTLSSLRNIQDLKVAETLHQGIRLDRQHGLLQKIIHTTVGYTPYLIFT